MFECTICSKGFPRRETLVNHVIRIHRGEINSNMGNIAMTPSTKQEIGKKFCKLKSDQASNENRDYKSIKCPDCEKVFFRKSTMEIHRRIHSGDKPYECSYCGKKFNRSNNLKLHIRTHTGEKPYKVKKLTPQFSCKHINVLNISVHC